MAPLSPADVKRWDPNAIHGVFQTASNRAVTLQTLSDNLAQVHNNLSDWHGEAGDAFRADVGKARRDIEADGHESKQVAAAVSRAEADVRAVKAELDGIEQAAEGNGFGITPDWRIDSGGMKLDSSKAAAKQQLQAQLDSCKLHAHSADQELATAIRSAVGDIPLNGNGPQPGAAPATPRPPDASRPKSLQDMLLPAGPAEAQPGGDPAKGPPLPAGAGGGKPPSLEDLMLGRGQPSGPEGQKPPPGSLPDLLSRLPPPAAAGVPAPRLKPAEVESFKAMARQSMLNDGVPPDQIDARLNDVVARTQQWMDDGMPNYVPPDPPRPPPPGFGEGFGDRWFATEQGIKNLVGQGGPGAPGVLQSWEQMLKGTVETAQNPMGAAINEFQHAVDSPSVSYYLGEKGADAAFTAPTMMFGGEGAAIGEIADLDVYAGMTHPPNLPIGPDNPTSYHPWSESAAQDLYSAFVHGEPTASLTQHLADMVTHYVGDNPDRVVLGRWDGQDGGYIGEARTGGGIYFDTGDRTWNALAEGLDKRTEQALVWPVNEYFLRTRMENQVGQIIYLLDHADYDSLEDMAEDRALSYSAYEVSYLNEVASAYGYERVGDSWVHIGGEP
jgi:uncharacterized protein YukE